MIKTRGTFHPLYNIPSIVSGKILFVFFLFNDIFIAPEISSQNIFAWKNGYDQHGISFDQLKTMNIFVYLFTWKVFTYGGLQVNNLMYSLPFFIDILLICNVNTELIFICLIYIFSDIFTQIITLRNAKLIWDSTKLISNKQSNSIKFIVRSKTL